MIRIVIHQIHIFLRRRNSGGCGLEPGIPVAEGDCVKEDVWSKGSLKRLEEVRKEARDGGG